MLLIIKAARTLVQNQPLVIQVSLFHFPLFAHYEKTKVKIYGEVHLIEHLIINSSQEKNALM